MLKIQVNAYLLKATDKTVMYFLGDNSPVLYRDDLSIGLSFYKEPMPESR